jgi:hypothetical protein
VSFAAITFCVASQRVFTVIVYFVINSVRKLWLHPHKKERISVAHKGVSLFVLLA